MKQQLIYAQKRLQEAERFAMDANYKDCIAVCLEIIKTFENQEKWNLTLQASNYLTSAYLSLLQYEKAQKTLDKIQALISSQHKLSSAFLAAYFNNWGDYWQLKNEYTQALEYYQDAFKIHKQVFGAASIELADSFYRIGKILGQKGEFEKELIYYRKALTIIQQSWKEEQTFEVKCHRNIAGVYGTKGDYDTQLNYLQKALNICLQSSSTLGHQQMQTASVLDDIGRAFAMKEKFQKALNYHSRALAIREKILNKFHHHLADSYFHIAYCLQSMEQFGEALEEYKKARRIREKLFGRNSASVAACFNSMGVCFGHLRMFFRQFDFHQKALEVLLKIFGIQHPEVAFTYIQLGYCWQRRNYHSQALQQFQFALVSLVEGFDSPNIYHNPRLKNDHLITLELLNAFSSKAISLFQHYLAHSHSKKDLRRAMVNFQVVLELLDKKRHSFQSEHSKLDLIHRFMPIYEGAIQTALELHRIEGSWQYLRTAFTLAEKGKSVLLLSSIKDLEAKGLAKIPSKLIAQEQNLRQQIVNLEKSIYQEQSIEEQGNEMRMSRLQSDLFDYQQQYQDLVEKLEQQYSDYYQLKYEFEVLDIKELQIALQVENENDSQEGEARILEYFVGEQNIYIFLITEQDLSYYIVSKPADFEQLVKKMVRSINQLRRQRYIQLAHQIYQLLFPTSLQERLSIEQKNAKATKLYIIPDASLFYLPFEALIWKDVKQKRIAYCDLPYLIKRFAISYHYSTSLLYNSLTKNRKNDMPPSYVGFAPIYKSEQRLISEERGDVTLKGEQAKKVANSSNITPPSPSSTKRIPPPIVTVSNRGTLSRSIEIDGKQYYELIHTEEEVRDVHQLFDNKGFQANSFFHQDASIANFLQQIDHSKFVHIAAHGIFNKKYPEFSGIVFSKSSQKHEGSAIFFIADAYHLQLQADLIVLSSCESGIGKLSKSEGLMAMNRALLYAGANNVIFTLFKVYDRSASQLIYLLFQGIVNHQLSYSEALQRAKLFLIQDEKMTPKSWAGFVLLGG